MEALKLRLSKKLRMYYTIKRLILCKKINKRGHILRVPLKKGTLRLSQRKYYHLGCNQIKEFIMYITKIEDLLSICASIWYYYNQSSYFLSVHHNTVLRALYTLISSLNP